MGNLPKVQKLLIILQIIGQAKEPLSTYAIWKRSGLEKKTVRAILEELREAGIVTKTNGKWIASDKKVYNYGGTIFVKLNSEFLILQCPYYNECWEKNCLGKGCRLMEELPAVVKQWLFTEEKEKEGG